MSAGGGGRGLPSPAPLRRPLLWLLLLLGAGGWGAAGSLSDHYQALGVPPDALAKDIKKAFRTLAMQWHPDKHQDSTQKALAAERMRELNEAYATLGNEDKRQAYDKLVAKIGKLGRWYRADAEPSRGLDLPEWVLAYFACPDYAEYRFGFFFALVFCTGFLTSHLPVCCALYFLSRWMAWGPVQPAARPLSYAWAAARGAVVLLLAVLGLLTLVLCVTYGEALYSICLLTLLPVASGYLLLSRLATRKTREAAEKHRQRLAAALWRHWARCDTPPVSVRVGGAVVELCAREAQRVQQQLARKEEEQARTRRKEDDAKEADRRRRRKEEQKREAHVKVADIQPAMYYSAPPAPPTEAAAVPATQIADNGKWTKEQQAALEKALRKYPTGTEARWDKIEQEVPGRTKKQCVERFQALASMNVKAEAEPFTPADDASKKTRKK